MSIEETFLTCINCSYFDENCETCLMYHARPPARVIAFGCPSFKDQVVTTTVRPDLPHTPQPNIILDNGFENDIPY